ncbi:MAG TPA: MtnX-like HAD-IB family phosphatase [Thermoanaerobaculia bacterium]|jgi:2-hydroxy-3-keto-5-methylthiopentenyl-1-phosphate phosphatase|nr:MtnX-like HAD-IB family phosphatase [Thermoanaerobaculia bacterium]
MLFIIDFDGTVAPADTVDALLEQFADPEWRRIEEEWVAGRINSRECMAAQLALVAAERPVLEGFLRSVAIDPAFAAFARHATTFADLAIVSDGLDYPIRQALQGLRTPPIPVFANRLGFRPGGLELSFPYTDAACSVKSGLCKCAVTRAVDAGRGLTIVLIGDGRSDQCVARRADYVFAKGSLIRFCETEQIPYIPFESFSDVLAIVKGWNIRPRAEQPIEERSCPLAVT